MKKLLILLTAVMITTGLRAETSDDLIYYEFEGLTYVLMAQPWGNYATLINPNDLEGEATEENLPDPSPYTGEVVIPENITYEGTSYKVNIMHDYSFLESTIESVDIPATITSFLHGVFRNCMNLRTLICRSLTPPTAIMKYDEWEYEDVFGDVDPDQVTVYVPDEVIQDYRYAGGFARFTNILPISALAQGVEKVESEKSDGRKVIKEGQMFIQQGEKTYTVLGQEK